MDAIADQITALLSSLGADDAVLHDTIVSVLVIAIAAVMGFVAHSVLFRVLGAVVGRSDSRLDNRIVATVRGPTRLLFVLAAVQAFRSAVPDEKWLSVVWLIVSVLMVFVFGWLVQRIFRLVIRRLKRRHAADSSLETRTIYTRYDLTERIVGVLIWIVTGGLMLLSIPGARSIGVSLLASAGAAGIVVGMAARPVLGNLLAGVQLGLTQPIRIGDVVIVEGEWGSIEQIAATYVVVKIWDKRRLVVPISYFIETPFQNWTHTSTDLLGTVFLYTDYSVPLSGIRAELERIVRDSPDWDGEAVGVQVTGATERTIEVRALVSANDAGKMWNLRCHVREKLLEYLQREHPEALPRTRTLFNPEGVALPQGGPTGGAESDGAR